MPKITKQTTRPEPPKPTGNGVLSRIRSVDQTKIGRLKVSLYGMPKCLGKGTLVLMFDGTTKNVEDVEVADKLIGPDSMPRVVESVAAGIGPLYQVVPIKGEAWVCNDEHLLTLTGTVNLKGKTRDVSVNDYLAEIEAGVPSCNNWRMLRATCIEFAQRPKLEIPPYLVGLWLGDGARRGSVICNGKQIVQDYCKQVAEEMGMNCLITPYPERNTAEIRFSAKVQDSYTPGRAGCNQLRTFFLSECSAGTVKRIPQKYLSASVEERQQLLAGIIDTDGKDIPSTSVTVTGEPYRDGLLFLARSLGLAAYCGVGQVHACANGKISTYFDVSISGDLQSLPTKVKKFPERKIDKRVNVVGFELEHLGEGQFFGFTLAGPDGRFLLGDFTVTHNTGKTRLACTFPKPLLICGFEDGTGSVAGVKGIEFAPLRTLGEFQELLDGPIAAGRWATVVVDNGTKMRDVRIGEIFGTLGIEVPERKPYLYADRVWKDVWTQCAKDLKDILGKLLDIPNRRDLNVVVIAQEQQLYEGDGSGVSDVIKPAISSALGKSVALFLNAECDYICQTFIREQTVTEKNSTAGSALKDSVVTRKTGKKEFCLRIGPHETYVTGFRVPLGRPELPEVIVDPSYAKIVKIIE